MTRRTEKIGEQIREELSDILRREVRDPRLSDFITITQVDVSPDLKFAKVFVSIMGTQEQRKDSVTGLNSASGFIRKILGKRLTIRSVPELSFRHDESIERGSRILELLKEVSTPEEDESNIPRELNQ